MTMTEIIIIIVAGVAAVVAAACAVAVMISISAGRRQISGQGGAINLLQQQLEAIRQSQDKQSQALEKGLQTGQENIGKHLQNSQQTLSELNNQIGRLWGSNQKLLELGTDIRGLRDIFQAPKLRGQMGEQSLANLLGTILPKEHYSLQYKFRSGGIVDAVVKLTDYIVPIDAKFPLSSFEAMSKTEDQTEKARLRRQFKSDVKDHIDKIAASYILPQEGTLDFALMYIPAENVYYETVIRDEADRADTAAYALGRKVVPVSPNLLYAYLMTTVMGLHGMQIEKQAAQIRTNLGRLEADFKAFASDYSILGGHLRNAYNKHDEGQKKFDRLELQLEQIASQQGQ